MTQPHPKVEHFVYVFLATAFEYSTPPSPDSGERIQVQLVDLNTLKAIAIQSDARGMPARILNQADTMETLPQLPTHHP